jgi:hypothetical protein
MDIGIYANPDYYFGYDSPEFQGTIADLTAATDEAERTRLMQAAQQRIADDYVNGFLFQLPMLTVAKAGVQGLWPNAPVARERPRRDLLGAVAVGPGDADLPRRAPPVADHQPRGASVVIFGLTEVVPATQRPSCWGSTPIRRRWRRCGPSWARPALCGPVPRLGGRDADGGLRHLAHLPDAGGRDGGGPALGVAAAGALCAGPVDADRRSRWGCWRRPRGRGADWL